MTPTLGHWYVRDYWTRGMAIRLGGAVAAGLGVLLVDATCDGDHCSMYLAVPIGIGATGLSRR